MGKPKFINTYCLDSGIRGRCACPKQIPSLAIAKVTESGKCATIHIDDGIAYVATHSRRAPKLWAELTGLRYARPHSPWVAYTGMTEGQGVDLASAWLASRRHAWFKFM